MIHSDPWHTRMHKTTKTHAPHTRRFLHFDHLFVAEVRPVMDELEGVVRVAVLTQDRLGDAAPFDLDRRRLVADMTLKERFPHLRHQGRCTNHQSVDCDQLVYVCRKKVGL